jgi:hypothetical protein
VEPDVEDFQLFANGLDHRYDIFGGDALKISSSHFRLCYDKCNAIDNQSIKKSTLILLQVRNVVQYFTRAPACPGKIYTVPKFLEAN